MEGSRNLLDLPKCHATVIGASKAEHLRKISLPDTHCDNGATSQKEQFSKADAADNQGSKRTNYDMFMELLHNREDDLWQWCNIATRNTAPTGLSTTLTFNILWASIAVMVNHFEHDIRHAMSFVDLIEATLTVLKNMDDLEKLLKKLVSFRHVQSNVTLAFTRQWSNMVHSHQMESQSMKQLPWKKTEICLAWRLVVEYAHRQANDMKRELFINALGPQHTANEKGSCLKDEQMALERVLCRFSAISGDPMAANQQLVSILKQFHSLCENHTVKLPNVNSSDSLSQPTIALNKNPGTQLIITEQENTLLHLPTTKHENPLLELHNVEHVSHPLQQVNAKCENHLPKQLATTTTSENRPVKPVITKDKKPSVQLNDEVHPPAEMTSAKSKSHVEQLTSPDYENPQTQLITFIDENHPLHVANCKQEPTLTKHEEPPSQTSDAEHENRQVQLTTATLVNPNLTTVLSGNSVAQPTKFKLKKSQVQRNTFKPTQQCSTIKGKKKLPKGSDDYGELDMMNDIQSLRRILGYLGLARKLHLDKSATKNVTDDSNMSLNFLLVERVLQVTGEGLKNTSNSQNLSKSRLDVLQKAGVPLKDLTDLRNALSHLNSLSAWRKVQAERSLDAFLIMHDFNKLEHVFCKALGRIQFKLAKKRIAEESNGVDLNNDAICWLTRLASCKTMQQIRKELSSNAGASAIGERLRFLVRQFDADRGPNMEEDLWDKDVKSYDQIGHQNYNGDEESKSVITHMSDMADLQQLLEKMSTVVTDAPIQNLSYHHETEFGLQCLSEFIDDTVQRNMSKEFFDVIAKELFLGYDFPVHRETIEKCLVWEDSSILSTPEDLKRMASVLQVLDTVMHIRENWGSMSDRSVERADRLVDLIIKAPCTPTKYEAVVDAATKLGLQDTDAQITLYNILLDAFQGSARTTNDDVTQVTKLVIQEISDKCSAISIEMIEGSKERPEIKSARLNLISFLSQKIDQQTGHLTLEKFEQFKKMIDEPLESTYVGGSRRTYERERKRLSDMASPFDKLVADLRKTKSLLESCAAFEKYLAQLDMTPKDRCSALSHFRLLEQASLESFLFHRISQLRQLLTNHDIYTDVPSSMDTAYSIYMRNPKLQAAVEMILLECLEILKDLYRGSTDFHYEPRPSLDGISLRNYLAHGDSLLDLCHPDLNRMIFENAMELATRGESIVALRKMCEEPTILEFIKMVRETGMYHTLYAANMPPMTNGDIQETLAKLQSVPDWTKTIEHCLSNKPILSSRKNIDGDVHSSVTRLMAEEALLALLENRDHHCMLLLQSHPQIACYQFHCGWTMLHHAVAQRDNATELIDMLVRCGADISAADDWAVRPLHIAVIVGHVDNLQALLRHQCIDTDARTIDRVSPLDVASRLGYIDAVEVLLDHKANPDGLAVGSQWGPLHLAASHGHAEVVQLLLRYKAAVNAVGSCNWTPLHLAIRQDHVKIVSLLLDQGASPHARLSDDPLNGGGSTVHVAAAYASVEVLQILIQHGISPETLASNRHGHHRTPLHWAAIRGRLDAVEFLVKCPEVDIENRDLKGGRTALDYALLARHLPVTQFLIKQGARFSPNMLITVASDGEVEFIKMLVESSGAKCDIEYASETPATVAVAYGRLEVLKYFMSQTPTDVEALMRTACRHGRLNIVRFLVEALHYPDASKPFADKRTPLHAATQQDRSVVVRYLVEECQVGLDVLDGEGNTPLVVALWRSSKSAVANYLLERGADISGENGQRALTAATRQGHWTMVRQLLEKGANMEDGFHSVASAAIRAGRMGILDFLVGNRRYDIQRLGSPAFLKELAQTAERHILHDLQRRGLDLSAPIDNDGTIGLHWAASAGCIQACDFFLDDLNVGINNADGNGWTALHHAAKNGQTAMVAHLLTKGADSSRLTNAGDTALTLVTRRGHVWPTVKLLLESQNMFENFTNDFGDTVLHLFLRVSNDDVELRYCLDRMSPAQIRWSNNSCNTVLHEAALQQSPERILRCILAEAKKSLTDDEFSDFLNRSNQNGNTALMLYIKEGQQRKYHIVQSAIELFCDYNADLNVQNTSGQLALHLAIEGTNVDVLTALMRPLATFKDDCLQHCVANPLLKDQNGMTPLQLAQSTGRQFCEFLLNYESDYKMRYLKDKQTLASYEAQMMNYIHKLAEGNSWKLAWSNPKAVQDVLQSYPKMQFLQSSDGRLPIHHAAYNGNIIVLQHLHNAGSDVNAKDGKGNNPLHIAADKGHLEAVVFLLECGAHYNVFNKEGLKPAHCAIAGRHLDVVRYFFQNRLLGIDDQNEMGESLLEMAVVANFSTGIEYLLGMYDNSEAPLANYQILNNAVSLGNDATVEVLLQQGALSKVIASGCCPKSPLYLAIVNEYDSIAKILMNAASDAQLSFLIANQGARLLCEAASRGQLEMVKCLVKRGGLSINAALEDGHTPLISATECNAKDMVKYLLEHGANPNAFLLHTEETPLHIAALRGFPEVTKLLLAHHANITTKVDSSNPLQIATSMGHLDVAIILLNGAGIDSQRLFSQLPVMKQEQMKAYAINKKLKVDIFT